VETANAETTPHIEIVSYSGFDPLPTPLQNNRAIACVVGNLGSIKLLQIAVGKSFDDSLPCCIFTTHQHDPTMPALYCIIKETLPN